VKKLPLSTSAKFLFPFVFLSQFLATFYATFQFESSALLYALSRLAFFWLISWWLVEDSRRRGISWPIDTGMFLYVAWIILIPYHLFRTRGVRAFIGILSLVGVMAAGWLAAAIMIVLIWY
jgi:hypothetical protein